MNEALEELDKILTQKNWLERLEQIIIAVVIIGGLFWVGHIVAWSFGGFNVGL